MAMISGALPVENAHRLTDDVAELDLAVFDLDAVVLIVEFLDQVRRRLNVTVERPEGQGDVFGLGG